RWCCWLLEWGSQQHQRIFLLGAKPAVLKQVTTIVQRDYPGIVVAGAPRFLAHHSPNGSPAMTPF
ncbi:hypothetical protein WP50_12355, partial [Lactiplantibacillus plantarum]